MRPSLTDMTHLCFLPPLPAGSIVDRKTIVQQLLNDPRDPFNRQPMSEDDLVPQPELSQRIQDWVAQQRANCMQE